MSEPPPLPERDEVDGDNNGETGVDSPSEDAPLTVKATQNYKKRGKDEISFKKGSIIIVTKKEEERYFGALIKKKSTGWFSCSVVEVTSGGSSNKKGKSSAKGKLKKRGTRKFARKGLNSLRTSNSTSKSLTAISTEEEEFDSTTTATTPIESTASPVEYGSRRERSITLEMSLSNRTNERKLLESGIIKPTKSVPIFGVPLGQLMYITYTIYELPDFFTETAAFLSSGDNPKIEGLFRISGAADEINNMKAAYDRGETTLLEGKSPHSVAGLLKLFFRSLPQPLLTHKQYDKFLQSTTIDDTDERLEANVTTLKVIPPHCLLILDRLIHLLRDVSKHSDINFMSSANLAIVFGPTLLRSERPDSMMFDSTKQQAVVEFMIDHYEQLFDTLDEMINYRQSE